MKRMRLTKCLTWILLALLTSIRTGLTWAKDFSSQFDIQVVEPIVDSSSKAIKGQIYKGFFQKDASSPRIYFEYQVPTPYQGVDVIEIAGFSKDSSYWEGPNKRADFLKDGSGILTFDGRVRGRTLEANRKEGTASVPSVVSTRDEAILLKELVRALQLKNLVVVGHSRGAGIAARFSEMILQENGARSENPMRILALYDLNGLVTYASRSFPKDMLASDSDISSGYIRERAFKTLEDGRTVELKIESPLDYYQELLAEWTRFEREYLEQPEKYKSTFFASKPEKSDIWDPYAKELTAQQFDEMVYKFPLLVQVFDHIQTAGEDYMVQMVSNRTLRPGKKREAERESLRAMMRGLRTTFVINDYGHRKKFFIPHSILPSLVQVAKAGVPIKVLYSPTDPIVAKHHISVKKAALKKFDNVELIRDDAGEGPSSSHYGPNRSIWSEAMVPRIQSRIQFSLHPACRSAHGAI